MAFFFRTLAIVLVLLPVSALGQGMFRPLQDFVEDIVPQAAPTPRPVLDAKSEPEPPPPLPKPRPAGLGEDPEPQAPAEPAPEVPAAANTADDRVYQTACPALISGVVAGKMLPPIGEGLCGAQSPLEVTALNLHGRMVELTSPIKTNCAMATALADWAEAVDAYAKAALGSELVALQTGTSYICRPRVGGGEAFTSEHGFANAVDLTGFTLADGRSVVVKDHWSPATTPESKLLRFSHGSACAKFTTVLGPEANADHEDHLHLDLGCHGQTCTAQICE